MPFALILIKNNVRRTLLILGYVTFFKRKTKQSVMLGMKYVDEKIWKAFRTCQEHTIRIVSILGAVKLLFTFVVLNTV